MFPTTLLPVLFASFIYALPDGRGTLGQTNAKRGEDKTELVITIVVVVIGALFFMTVLVVFVNSIRLERNRQRQSVAGSRR